MSEPGSAVRVEARWPVVLAIVTLLFLLVVLPDRIRLLPLWALYVIGAVVLAPMIAVSLGTAQTRWLRIERMVTLLFIALVAAGNLGALAYLIVAMIRRSTEMHGLQLLTSAVGVWITNALMFSLWYWQIDRGGPASDPSKTSVRSDLYFVQEGVPADRLPPRWRPMFVDYLFAGFSIATAMSPTDVLPLTPRAKMSMLLESAISLVTIVVVAARAINVLGS
jgi:hypothetical protein